MEAIRPPREEERAAFCALAAEYLPDIAPARAWDMPLRLGLFLEGRLIGLAFGQARSAREFCLQGIAVAHPYNAQGRGGRLLRALEDEARRRGFAALSVGSAGGYVERFYQKNGYRAVELKIRTPRGTVVLPVFDYAAMDKATLTAQHGGTDSFFVFYKALGDES